MKLQFFRFLALVIVLLTYSHSPVFAQVVWGDADSRTEYRDNAGLQGNAGAKSGFYQTNNPVNFPPGATSYWHLLDVRHSNSANNYAMQFSGSFFDQNLYFRKTNNNASQTWSRILLETGGKVGIGTTSPVDKLDIQGSTTSLRINPDYNGSSFIYSYNNTTYTPLVFQTGSFQVTTGTNTNSLIERFRIDASGNVGIATANPREKLHIQGSGTSIRMNPDYNGTSYIYSYNNTAYTPLVFQTASFQVVTGTTTLTERLRVTETGNVGIGIASPAEKLSVNGNVQAKKVIVTQSGWADYVFDSAYSLQSLAEVENYVKANKRLPGMPAETEIAQHGLDVGEMMKRQQEKIEELTLYLIDMRKQNEALMKKNMEYEKRLQKLEESK
jgi:hypothetical protein